MYQGDGYAGIVDRPEPSDHGHPVFDYEPSAMRIHSGDLRIWTCGLSPYRELTAFTTFPEYEDHQGDAIYLTVYNTDHPTAYTASQLGFPTTLVMDRSLAGVDHKHACSPSVVQPGPSPTTFRMYYECAQTDASPGKYPYNTWPNTLQICMATSTDAGLSWTKWPNKDYPKPLIYTVGDKKGVYGVGHTSALMNPDPFHPGQTVLYYPDDVRQTNPDGSPLLINRRAVFDESGVKRLSDQPVTLWAKDHNISWSCQVVIH